MTTTHLLIIRLGDHQTPIGEVQIDTAGVLTLVSAVPEQADYMEGWVQRLNENEEFTLKVPPPAQADAPMLSSHGRRFSRSQSSFLDDLKAYVHQLYGLKLMSPAEFPQQIDDLGQQGH